MISITSFTLFIKYSHQLYLLYAANLSDFSIAIRTISVPTTTCFEITVINDPILENDEVVILQLQPAAEDLSVVNVSGNQIATFIIQNDDCKR